MNRRKTSCVAAACLLCSLIASAILLYQSDKYVRSPL